MKIEIGESLCYSYLRHVKRCWLVQTNWKSSEHWVKCKTDAELDIMFEEMRRRFDMDGNVFKQNASVKQFMQQAEIDVIGIDQDGSIHAMDVAFHEKGLQYGGGAANRVLKKMLRAYILLTAYHPPETRFEIYFASPKVHPGPQASLEADFATLREQYPGVCWHLITNEDCRNQIVSQTLERADSVADTAELFVRSVKLLNLSGMPKEQPQPPLLQPNRQSRESGGPSDRSAAPVSNPQSAATRTQLQDLVRGLMKTLLEESPILLDDADLRNLMDYQYCAKQLRLKIGNHALIREQQQGREVNGRSRYWKDLYAGRFYVCSQWWKDYHLHNANSLLQYLDKLSREKPKQPDILKLDRHKALLDEFVAGG